MSPRKPKGTQEESQEPRAGWRALAADLRNAIQAVADAGSHPLAMFMERLLVRLEQEAGELETEIERLRAEHKSFQDEVDASAARIEEKLAGVEAQSNELLLKIVALQAERDDARRSGALLGITLRDVMAALGHPDTDTPVLTAQRVVEEHRKALQVLDAIRKMPGIEEVLAPRDSLGSLLRAADELCRALKEAAS